ncbi:hypothetical protein C8R45DRAFT_995347 [Mycena sanguinolenta]|nr:hypothetical protein C8R45DRAFT_995347 [Mycena sanguinolenta]
MPPSASPKEQGTRSLAPDAEKTTGDKGYRTNGEVKEEVQEPENAQDASRDEPGVLKIKTDSAPRSPRNCAPEESRREFAQEESTDSPASSSRTPLSPHDHYRSHPQAWSNVRAPEHNPREQHGTPHWYQPPTGDPHHEQHAPNVRLPGIAALLTEPYSAQNMPRYDDRQPQDWPHAHPHASQPSQMPPPPEHYPPMVAALPLDDSRARTPQPMPHRKRGRLPKETTDFLKAWLHSHAAHPYPSEIEKKQMCHATGLSMSQVSNWMINGRRRILGPSYLSTSRSGSTNAQHTSPPVQLSSPSVVLQSPSVMLTNPGPVLMLRAPPGHQS